MALTLGFPHPDYLMQYLSSEQFSEWLAYSVIEPFGPSREDERAGVIASEILRPNLKKGKKVSAADFFPDRTKIFKKKKKQPWQQQLKQLMPLVKDK